MPKFNQYLTSEAESYIKQYAMEVAYNKACNIVRNNLHNIVPFNREVINKAKKEEFARQYKKYFHICRIGVKMFRKLPPFHITSVEITTY